MSKFENLYDVLVKTLKFYGKTLDDIEFVAFKDKAVIPTEDFLFLAKNFDYVNTGYDIVKDDIVVVGKDWWLDRQDHDFYTEFVYHTKPTKPDKVVGRGFSIKHPRIDD